MVCILFSINLSWIISMLSLGISISSVNNFKIRIDAGTEECFYKAHGDRTTLHIYFQVTK